ncbi:ABC transporter substrate-binding protein [Clostridium sp. LP20]|uniref:ABC transporter substrate-binding protein n=1 Tax=Clostridium sp. LP20 TaxID=3418665 RepID=UPI003EE43451
MIKKLMIAALIGVSILGVSCGKATTEVAEAKKVVSATVSATQVMDKFGLDLVGVPKTSTTLPERYNGVQEIGQAFAPNFETIVSLNPDLLIFDINFKEKVEKQVSDYGMNAFYFNTKSFTEFKNSIIELGDLTGKKKEAKKVVTELQESVDKVLAKGKKSDSKPKVAIVFGSAESYMLATDTSYVGDLLNTICVDNITDDIDSVNSAYLNFSMEQVVQMNPDYILRLSHGDLEESKKAFEKEFATNPAWSSLKATKEGKVYDLDPGLFAVTANLSVTDAIEELGKIIYGE